MISVTQTDESRAVGTRELIFYEQEKYFASVVCETVHDVNQRAELKRRSLIRQCVLVGRFFAVVFKRRDVVRDPVEPTDFCLVPN